MSFAYLCIICVEICVTNARIHEIRLFAAFAVLYLRSLIVFLTMKRKETKYCIEMQILTSKFDWLVLLLSLYDASESDSIVQQQDRNATTYIIVFFFSLSISEVLFYFWTLNIDHCFWLLINFLQWIFNIPLKWWRSPSHPVFGADLWCVDTFQQTRAIPTRRKRTRWSNAVNFSLRKFESRIKSRLKSLR